MAKKASRQRSALPGDQDYTMTERGLPQVVPSAELQIAKLERYLARDPKGPKAKKYRVQLDELKGS